MKIKNYIDNKIIAPIALMTLLVPKLVGEINYVFMDKILEENEVNGKIELDTAFDSNSLEAEIFNYFKNEADKTENFVEHGNGRGYDAKSYTVMVNSPEVYCMRYYDVNNERVTFKLSDGRALTTRPNEASTHDLIVVVPQKDNEGVKDIVLRSSENLSYVKRSLDYLAQNPKPK